MSQAHTTLKTAPVQPFQVLTPETKNALVWFARHDLRLAWRDFSQLFVDPFARRRAGGGSSRIGMRPFVKLTLIVCIAVFALGVHALAQAMLQPFYNMGAPLDFFAVNAIAFISGLVFTMLLSQAMEAVTRAFYARDDLDLILSSPAPAGALFAVRVTAIAATTAVFSTLAVAPFVIMTAVNSGIAWLAGFVIVLVGALLATSTAVLLVLAMFRFMGARQTRLASQIFAAVIGASFVIGLQVMAIIVYGAETRLQAFSAVVSTFETAPAPLATFWAQAVAGHVIPLLSVVAFAVTVFVLTTAFAARVFLDRAISAQSVSARAVDAGPANRSRWLDARRTFGPRFMLMRKEWALLARDPWLISQSAMQLLYLLPPAVMLWVEFGARMGSGPVMVAPVVVAGVGQLAGALAWLTISGEDAFDLVDSAPVDPSTVLFAKIGAVLSIVGMLIIPFVAAIALFSLWTAFLTLLGAMVAAGNAIAIQLWFKQRATRAAFRRRQTASKAATICEAFASLLMAGVIALAASGLWIWVIPAGLVALVMVIAWTLREGRGEGDFKLPTFSLRAFRPA
ncbi:MAG: permease [Pseudomonadota bacterium]